MAKKKYHVTLSSAEHEELEHLIRRGKASARKLTRARLLLKAAAGETDDAIARALGVGIATVERTRQRFVAGGVAALSERSRPGKAPKLAAKAEARLIAEACSTAPDGRERWTLQLLADRVVTLGLAPTYSDESVRRVLKKTLSSRG
jgi:transposase